VSPEGSHDELVKGHQSVANLNGKNDKTIRTIKEEIVEKSLLIFFNPIVFIVLSFLPLSFISSIVVCQNEAISSLEMQTA